ncbi:cation:proton antiporter [Nocardia higoensis]|uniref:Cation:proton antiporter n=1 Tax=Nocardia higoensis TaxID=228599 RepID=A0ABS0D7Y3_9NOCA|nr:cation:proton antiporter family protein [Nocardia higoensis]MBF6353747.1 cation:proton antiporter [Nocardia higoensis]
MELHAFPIIAAVLAIAVAIGSVAVRLRQPLIVSFIGVGILVGPLGTGWVQADDTIELLSRMGIAILLFLVGLRLDLHLIRSTGRVALVTGLVQIALTAMGGYLIALAFGMSSVAALYVGIALAFSSTIIVVKLLSDKHELDQLHGRIAVGILIVQDLVVVLVMITLTAFAQPANGDSLLGVAAILGKGVGLLAGTGLLMRFVLPWLLEHVARSQELLVLFGVAYAASVAAVSEWLGFGTEVGAFLAGVSLASTPYRDALGARMVSLRDFLLLFFFVDLGARLQFDNVVEQISEAVVLSVFVLLVKPLIILVTMSALRYPARVGLPTGLTMAQISEFSLILAALGLGLGHIDSATVSLITVVGLVTITGSTYLIMYSGWIRDRLEPRFAVLDRTHSPAATAQDPDTDTDVILYGLGRFGRHLAERLSGRGIQVLVVDFDPHRIATTVPEGVAAVFGSAEDVDLLNALPLERTRCVVSAIPVVSTNLALLHNLRHHGYAGPVVLTAHTIRDAGLLREAGVTVVLEPFTTAATTTADTLHQLLRRLDED